MVEVGPSSDRVLSLCGRSCMSISNPPHLEGPRVIIVEVV